MRTLTTLMTLTLFIYTCSTIFRESGVEMLRCQEGNEVCYIHHQILPTDDRWMMDCFYVPKPANTITVPPELGRVPGGTR